MKFSNGFDSFCIIFFWKKNYLDIKTKSFKKVLQILVIGNGSIPFVRGNKFCKIKTSWPDWLEELKIRLKGNGIHQHICIKPINKIKWIIFFVLNDCCSFFVSENKSASLSYTIRNVLFYFFIINCYCIYSSSSKYCWSIWGKKKQILKFCHFLKTNK